MYAVCWAVCVWQLQEWELLLLLGGGGASVRSEGAWCWSSVIGIFRMDECAARRTRARGDDRRECREDEEVRGEEIQDDRVRESRLYEVDARAQSGAQVESQEEETHWHESRENC